MNLLYGIEHSKAKVVIFDIDGTLKDLCKEHSNALLLTLDECNTGKIRKNAVLLLNKAAMLMVKTGVFSTNHRKQNVLIKVFAILSGTRNKNFVNEYFKNYAKQLYLFDGACELLCALKSEKTVYFATINKQNYNLEEYGIPEEKIVYTEGALKVATYSKILKDIGVQKQDVIIVGDNVFDDMLSAKLLGVKCLLVNHYNNKLKAIFCAIVNRKYLK